MFAKVISRQQKLLLARKELKEHAQLPSGARNLNSGLSLYLHSFFECTSSEVCDENAGMGRLVLGFTAHECHKCPCL